MEENNELIGLYLVDNQAWSVESLGNGYVLGVTASQFHLPSLKPLYLMGLTQYYHIICKPVYQAI